MAEPMNKNTFAEDLANRPRSINDLTPSEAKAWHADVAQMRDAGVKFFEPATSYMYDERGYGAVPTKEAAQKLLEDFKAGKVCLHPISEPGCMERLSDIAAGRAVDPAFWQH